MTKTTQTTNILPADRLSSVSEYYFSRKLKEVAKLNNEGKDIISLAIGSPDMPPSKATIEKLQEVAQMDNAHGYQPTIGIPELRNATNDGMTSLLMPIARYNHLSVLKKEYYTSRWHS